MENIQDDFIDIETMDGFSVENHVSTRLEEEIYLKDPEYNPPEVDYDSIGEFCFESEQLALKGNSDYKNLLEAIVVLESQRMQAVQDLHQLIKMKVEALEDPFKFLEDMKQGHRPNFPFPQKIHPLPSIDWGKYAVNEDPVVFTQRQRQNCTRKKMFNKLPSLHSKNDSLKSCSVWSFDEQKRLKELLVEYPPEEPENQRWEKISKSLLSRTAFEVATRVHKYYNILTEEMPNNVGKLPDLNTLRKLWYLDGTDEPADVNPSVADSSESICDDESEYIGLHDSPEYQELVLLKKALKKKVSETHKSLQHPDKCLCTRCSVKATVNSAMYSNPSISLNSGNQSDKSAQGFVDTDYLTSFNSSYLDPNYLPAT